MVLIIPEAQTPFSIVEQPRQNPNAPSGFEGIAALADVGIDWKAAKVKAENDRAVRDARIGALQELDTARIEFETTGQMEGLGDRWAAEAGAIADKWAESVPRHMRADFALGLRETIAPQTGAIRRREFGLFRDHERSALNGSLREVEKLAANAPDAASREAILKDGASIVQQAVDDGLYSAVEGEAILSNLPANAARVEAMGLVDSDPQAFLDRIDEFRVTMDPEEAKRFELAAKGNVAAEDTRRAREDALLAKKAEAETRQRVDGAIDILESGRPYKGLPELLAETAGTPEGDRLQATIDAVGTEENFALMTPRSQRDYIAAEAKKATGDPADVGRLNRLRAINERTEADLAKDRIAYVRDRGLMDLAPVDISDPASVHSRIVEAEIIHEDFTPGAATIQYFDQGETDRLAAELKGDDPDRALAVIALIERNFGDRAPLALAQIGEKDPVAHLAGALVLDTGDTTASRYILQGRKMRDRGEGAKVSADVRRAVAAEFAPVLSWMITPDGRVVQDKRKLDLALQAADAHFAATGLAIADPKSSEAKEAYRLSVMASMGRTDRGGATYGGVQTVNGIDTVLPGNLSADRVERAIAYFDAPQWKRASISGNPPMWGPTKPFHDFPAADRAKVGMLSLGGGLYALGYKRDDGSMVFLRDDSRPDGMFVFNLEKLVTGVDRE
jgi:hypothetical protein